MKLIIYFYFLAVLSISMMPFIKNYEVQNELKALKSKYDPRDDVENYNYFKKASPNFALDGDKKLVALPKLKNVVLPTLSGDVYWEGWIKYFHYDSDVEVTKPTNFYENPDYFTQNVKGKKYLGKDSRGHRTNIPSKTQFWAQLLATDNFNIMSTRKNAEGPLAKTIENLNTDLIDNIIREDNANGAVKDLGTFHEGSCIRVNVKKPNKAKKDPLYNPRVDQEAETEVWVICTDDEKQHDRLMKYLIAIKLKRQEQINDVLEEVKPDPTSAAELMNNQQRGPVIVRYKGADATADDGYWVLLQDWSDCSLKCGGGTQTQQWMCVPPKNKGKPCLGNETRIKKCNEKPCPNVGFEHSLIKKAPHSVTLAPIYKALPFSNRPQQYIKCLIKENDVLYKTKEYDPEKKTDVKVPGRIVMNTQTISVFPDDTYSHALFNFNLPDTVIALSKTDHCCFYLINANRQFELCGFNNNCGSPTNPIWVNSWMYDFGYFRTKCFQDLKDNSLNLPNVQKVNAVKGKSQGISPGMPGAPMPMFTQAQNDIVNGRKQIIEKEIEQNAGNELEKKIGETHKVALTALRREINLEDLIKNEELQKGKEENQQLIQQVAQEKKKKNLLENALHLREGNFAKLRVAKETKMQIDNIKQEAKLDISFKRAVLKKKIEAIRNKFKRKNRLLQQQVQLIRSEMAEEIMNANKQGKPDKCKSDRHDLLKIAEYCDSNFSDDYLKNQTCKEPSNFCYSCCENEFGNMFIAQRDDCQTMCDNLDKADLGDGDWVWSVDGAK